MLEKLRREGYVIEKSDLLTPLHVIMFRLRVFRLILQKPCNVLYKHDNTVEYSLSPNLTWYQRLPIYALSLFVPHCCPLVQQ